MLSKPNVRVIMGERWFMLLGGLKSFSWDLLMGFGAVLPINHELSGLGCVIKGGFWKICKN